MTAFTKQAFADSLRGFMRSQRREAMQKRAVSEAGIPPEMLAQIQQPMPQPSPEEIAAMQAQEQAAQPQQGDGQPQEKIVLQATGNKAVEVVGSMLGRNDSGIPMEVEPYGKTASFRDRLGAFMQLQRLEKQASDARHDEAVGLIGEMVKEAACKSKKRAEILMDAKCRKRCECECGEEDCEEEDGECGEGRECGGECEGECGDMEKDSRCRKRSAILQSLAKSCGCGRKCKGKC